MNHLSAHGIKSTAVREAVWKKVMSQKETFSLADMEELLPDMDRSSIFRALRLFAEHTLLHVIDDGTGIQKYCVCRCENGQHLNHIHFTCLNCGQTYCFEDYLIPVVEMPEGFVAQDTEYIVKGICIKCKDKVALGDK